MKQTIAKVSVRDLVKGYIDNAEEGVKGYNGKLDIRPAYQREFVYNDKQRNEVINTINKGAFLGVFTWVKREDGTYEVLDGQQRTLSICQYVNGDYSINERNFHNLFEEEKEAILNYEILVNLCEGTETEKLEWFEIINIAGAVLTKQELRNAVYTGPWLSDAKRKFSKRNCVAYKLANNYVKGDCIRQEYLETALDWISNGSIESYMSAHQHDATATELWNYFSNVINWVIDMFPTYRKEMKGLNWGELYEKYHNNSYNPKELESRINELMANEEVTEKKGVYEYVLSGENEELARKLSKRVFSEKDKRTAYERQNGRCPITGTYYPIEEMEGDHIKPWWMGGTTTLDNLQMVWKHANRIKGGKLG